VKLPSPNQREVIRTFLHEATDLHIDAVVFFRPESGIGMTVHYKDARGFSHKKTMRSPDGATMSHIEDMVVLMSEWLVHPTTTKQDELLTAGSC
jgi:hypothetical protein